MSAPSLRAAIAAFALFFSASLYAEAPSLEGQWSGTLGHRDDTAALGLEFTRNDKAELIAAATLPATHMVSIPFGPVKLEGTHVTGSGFDLTLEGDALTGTFGEGNRLHVAVHRSDHLPSAPPPVAAPAGPSPLWSYAAHAPLWATPAIAGDLLCVGAADGTVHAVRLADGTAVWTRATGGAIFGEALAAGDTLYLVNDAGLLLALDLATGRERWHADLGGGTVPRQLPANQPPYDYDYQAPTPVLADGVLYVGAADGGCHARDAATGRPLWRFAAGGKVRTSALVLPDRVLFSCLDQFVYALDRKTGTLLWRSDTGGAVTTSPVLAADNVVVGTRGYLIVALRPGDGSRAWDRFQWFSWVESTPALVDDTLYIGSSDNRTVRALAAVDGHTLWSTDVGGWPWARPAVSASTIFASVAGPADYPLKPAPEGSLCALNRRIGTLRWRIAAPAVPGTYLHGFVGAPLIAGDRVVVGALDGTLRAYPANDATPEKAP